MKIDGKIIVTGAAGLVGQNLVPRLKKLYPGRIVGIDKHAANTRILSRLHPDIEVVEVDLAEAGDWEKYFEGASVLVLNHAQIGALTQEPFIANNITSTKHVLAAAKRYDIPYIVHISSSVINSKACDYYTESKREQEKLVLESGVANTVLRPTLMFGWFDRKHLGWLARFMKVVPVFPVPGNGHYVRQPLYAGDFSDIIASCIANPLPGKIYNISGQEKIDYIDLVCTVREATNSRATIIRVPYSLFWALLKIYAVFDRDPPFTTGQLEALVIPEVFEIIDWPSQFNVSATPLLEAMQETFQDPVYSDVVLEF